MTRAEAAGRMRVRFLLDSESGAGTMSGRMTGAAFVSENHR